jgi:flavin-dependent dehydrogenase
MRCREETLRKIESSSFDVCVIGGGATGAGCALDAQLRGLRTVPVEAGKREGMYRTGKRAVTKSLDWIDQS